MPGVTSSTVSIHSHFSDRSSRSHLLQLSVNAGASHEPAVQSAAPPLAQSAIAFSKLVYSYLSISASPLPAINMNKKTCQRVEEECCSYPVHGKIFPHRLIDKQP